jgi:TolB-like protein
MATVYLALDVKHERPVALKVLHADLAATLGSDRFLQEIRLAARLQHPHIVPLHDSGSAAGLLWYTMPFIEGESLRERLNRDGRLPTEVALRIGREVAEALDYAHRHMVVHRDVKPENILLEDRQAIVADFGIARAITVAGKEGLTAAGLTLGTPAYMSPEQVTGADLDGRSDIYSLGCVLFEILVGEPPFSGGTSQAIMTRRCIEPPRRVRSLRAEVSPAVDDAVNRCLAPTPDERFSSAARLAEALSAHAAQEPPPQYIPPKASRQQGRRATPILLLAGFLLMTIGLVLYHRLSSPKLDPRRVIVAVFANRTGDPSLDALGNMASDWVTQGLARTNLMDVVDAAAVHIGGRAASGHPLEARVLAQRNGATIVVSGSYYRSHDSLVFQSVLTDVRTGRLLKALDPIGGPTAEPLELVERTRQGVIAALATLVDPRFGPFMAANARLPTLASYQQFVGGQDAFWRGDWDRATTHFSAAAELDSSFLSAPVWLATTRAAVYDCPTTDSVGQVLGPRRNQLNEVDLLLLDRMLAWCGGNWGAVLHLARRTAELEPYSAKSRFMVGFYAAFHNRPAETAAILERLDFEHDLGWMSDSARMMYWAYLTGAHHSLADYRTELEQARRLIDRVPNRLAPLYYEARALAASGRPTEAIDRLERAAGMESEPGVYTGLFSFDFPPKIMSPGWVAYQIAVELQAHNQPAGMVRASAEHAIAWYRDHPATDTTELVLLARSLELLGRYGEAEAVTLTIPAAGRGAILREGMLGVLAARRGDRAATERADSVLARASLPAPTQPATVWRAQMAALLGDRSRAIALLRDAFAHGQLRTKSLFHHNPSFASLRGYPPFEELW